MMANLKVGRGWWVLLKADTLTTAERHTWSARVRWEVDTDSGTPIWDMLGQLYRGWDTPDPYTVIGSEMKLEGQYLRNYPWGTVDTTEHSNVLLLLEDVFVSGVQIIKDETDRRYYKNRPSFCAAVKARTSGEIAKSKTSKTCVGHRVWIRSSTGAAKEEPRELRGSSQQQPARVATTVLYSYDVFLQYYWWP
eukprot:jgi/Botrbrau1/22798/Bobra.0132s0124.1